MQKLVGLAKSSLVVVLIFVVVGPPAGALTWLALGVVKYVVYCPLVGCVPVASFSVSAGEALFLPLAVSLLTIVICMMSYIFGAAQAAAVGAVCAAAWVVRGRLSYMLAIFASAAMVLAMPSLYVVGATWSFEGYGLRPRQLARGPAEFLQDTEKLIVWLTVNIVAAVAAVRVSKVALERIEREGSAFEILS